MKKIYWIVGSLVFMAVTACQPGSEQSSNKQTLGDTTNQVLKRQNPKLTQDHPVTVDYQNPPKNIVLLIGDGMGMSQISAGVIAKRDALHIEKFRQIGLVKTFSASNLITDSAAGATAYATGHKTYNGAIGVDADTNAVPTILEAAEAKGLATGLVSTSSITHATPASFIAHQPSRDMEQAIAADFLKTPVDVIMGGGRKFFANRDDDRNLLDSLRQKGYKVHQAVPEAKERSLESNSVQKLAVLGAKEGLPRISEGRGNFLSKAAQISLQKLSQNRNGFFLMIEGSQIDWGGHENEAQYIKNEMIDFDKAVGQVLEFARQDGQTLVLVTADHECGGFSLEMNKQKKTEEVRGDFTTDYHTAQMVPIFAYGPGAQHFMGVQDNTSVYYKMKQALQLSEKK